MKGKCIFKVWCADVIWSVKDVTSREDVNERVFRVYRERRWYNHICFYSKDFAIAACVEMATFGVSPIKAEVLR